MAEKNEPHPVAEIVRNLAVLALIVGGAALLGAGIERHVAHK